MTRMIEVGYRKHLAGGGEMCGSMMIDPARIAGIRRGGWYQAENDNQTIVILDSGAEVEAGMLYETAKKELLPPAAPPRTLGDRVGETLNKEYMRGYEAACALFKEHSERAADQFAHILKACSYDAKRGVPRDVGPIVTEAIAAARDEGAKAEREAWITRFEKAVKEFGQSPDRYREGQCRAYCDVVWALRFRRPPERTKLWIPPVTLEQQQEK